MRGLACYYKPNKGIAMGSPISSTLAEIYLQLFQRIYLKHHLETKNIIYYKRSVDDLIIIYDHTKTDADAIYDGTFEKVLRTDIKYKHSA